jgi:hypothetical protein
MTKNVTIPAHKYEEICLWENDGGLMVDVEYEIISGVDPTVTEVGSSGNQLDLNALDRWATTGAEVKKVA